jgi:hypothetical protein
MLRLLARRPAEEAAARWSPFARNLGADREAVAQALLAAAEHEACALEELTASRYSELRRRRPQIGLPRTTTVTAVCGSWQRAVEAAERRAAALTRRAAFA